MLKKIIAFILLAYFISCQSADSYGQVTIQKSEVVKEINGKQYYVHLVEQGQTLYSISKVYNVSVDEIIFENRGAADGLKVYQTLNIPMVSRDVAIHNKLRAGNLDFVFHIARGDENLTDIADIYAVPKSDLRAANPGIQNVPRQGQYIKIPVRKKKTRETFETEVISHLVMPQETFYSISKKYHVSIDNLKAVNPGIAYPKAGEYLNVPVRITIQKPVEKKKLYFEHKVGSGETLYSLSRKYQVDQDSIRAYNPGLIDAINFGQVLKIPYKRSDNDFIVHRVTEKRSNLKKLAKKYAVSIDLVRKMNPRLQNRISHNQRVRIPVDPDALAYEIPETEPVVADTTFLESEVRPDKCIREFESSRTYKVALMLPLFLEELQEQQANPTVSQDDFLPFRFLQFYQGVRMAVDSLRQQGINLELYVYDVDQHITKTIKVLQTPELTDMDLIIGPFYRTSFKYAANFAELFEINIVNPLSKSHGILDGNPYIFKVQPSRNAELDLLLELVKDKFPDHKVLVVRHNKLKDSEIIAPLKGGLEVVLDQEYPVWNFMLRDLITDLSLADTTLEPGTIYDSIMVEDQTVYMRNMELEPEGKTIFFNDVPEIIYANDSIYGVIRHASIIRPNLVIALSDNEVFALEIMTALNEVKDTFNITLISFPDWSRFENLEVRYLLNFNTHVFAPVYIDYQDEKTKEFIIKYRKEYLTEPLGYAYDGFDIAYYFMSALKKYGPDFGDCLHDHKPVLIQTEFDFEKTPDGGYENIYWNIYRYHNFQVEKQK